MCAGDEIRRLAIEKVVENAARSIFLTAEELHRELLENCRDIDEKKIAKILAENKDLFFMLESSRGTLIYPLPKAVEIFLSLRGIGEDETDFEHTIPADEEDYAKYIAEYVLKENLSDRELLRVSKNDRSEICLEIQVLDNSHTFQVSNKVKIKTDGNVLKLEATRLRYIVEVIMG